MKFFCRKNGIYLVPLILACSYNLIFPTSLFSFISALQEHEEPAQQGKQQLVDYYWETSQRLLEEGLFDEAIAQAQRVQELLPHDKQVNRYIQSIKRRKREHLASGGRLVERAEAGKRQARREYSLEQELAERRRRGGSEVLVREQTDVPAPASRSETSRQMPLLKKKSRSQEKEIKTALKLAKDEHKAKRHVEALYHVNKVLVMDPGNKEALKLKREILQKGREQIIKRSEKERRAIKVEDIKKTTRKGAPPAEAIPDEALQEALVDAQKKGRYGIAAKDLAQALDKAKKAYKQDKYDQALFFVNQYLVANPDNVEALELKSALLKDRQKQYEKDHRQKRASKAQTFRDRHHTEVELSAEDLRDIEKLAEIRFGEDKKEHEAEQRRRQLKEAQIREDLRKKVEVEEQESLDHIIKEVEESKFYEKFNEYDKKKKQKETLHRRQIHSFLLRAEGLMEMQRYEEATAYLNNVFKVEPYNEKAQKMRQELQEKQFEKKLREGEFADKIFKEEKREYKKIRDKVRKEKERELMQQAEMYYKEGDWLNARQWAQKVLIINPSDRSAKRFLKKVDKKLVAMQGEIKKREEAEGKMKRGAMDEAFHEAARALELALIKEKKEDVDIQGRVKTLIAEADTYVMDKDYGAALVELNKAYAIDPGNAAVVKEIKRVRELQEKQSEAGEKSAADETVAQTEAEKKDAEAREVISITAEEEQERKAREAEEKKKKREEKLKTAVKAREEEEKVENRGVEMLTAAAHKGYRHKVDQYVKNAQLYLEQNEFEKAKKEVERIFLFDKNNPTAKDLLARITEYEIAYSEKAEYKSADAAFKRGLELEKLKTALQEETSMKEVVREPRKARIEDRKAEKEAIEKLLKEGKSLYKDKRYYEAINKFEAVFAIDAHNSTASKYIDKVKEAMIKEREKEREKIKERQRADIHSKLDEYADEIRELQSKGRYTEAAIIIEKGLILDPANKYFKKYKEDNQKLYDEQLARERSPDEKKKNLVNLGIKEFIQGNYIEAKKYFQRVLDIDPTDEKAANSIKKINAKIENLDLQE